MIRRRKEGRSGITLFCHIAIGIKVQLTARVEPTTSRSWGMCSTCVLQLLLKPNEISVTVSYVTILLLCRNREKCFIGYIFSTMPTLTAAASLCQGTFLEEKEAKNILRRSNDFPFEDKITFFLLKLLLTIFSHFLTFIEGFVKKSFHVEPKEKVTNDCSDEP